jgi:uncharacterized membrane protein YfcA
MPYLIGLISGIVGGMGIGGGTILIPAFILFMSIDQHVIQSVNLIYFIPTAIVALIVHIRNKLVDYKTALSIVAFGALGAVMGAYAAVNLPSFTLKKMFGIFLFFMGLYEMLAKEKSNNHNIKKK